MSVFAPWECMGVRKIGEGVRSLRGRKVNCTLILVSESEVLQPTWSGRGVECAIHQSVMFASFVFDFFGN